MAKLKAGTVANLDADTLAGRMDKRFLELWPKENGPLPDDQRAVDDRRRLFVAIAQGMLEYLEDHLNDIETTEERANGSGSEHAHRLWFDWE